MTDIVADVDVAPEVETEVTPVVEESESEKAAKREGYKARKLAEENARLKSQLEAKTRAELSEKTEAEQVREELEYIKSELAREKTAALKNKVATELNLPAEIADRLTGDDYESLYEDGQNLAKLFKPAPKVGTTTQPARVPSQTIDDQIAAALRAKDSTLAFKLHRQKMASK